MSEATEPYFPPPESAGGWRWLRWPDEVRTIGGMDPDKLHLACEFNAQFAQSFAPGEHMFVDAVDQGTVEIEKKCGFTFLNSTFLAHRGSSGLRMRLRDTACARGGGGLKAFWRKELVHECS